MPNAGGNTSSSKKGLQHIKGTSQLVPDTKALNSTETFANPDNLMIDEPYLKDYPNGRPGRQVGYNYDILSNPENTEDTQGNSGWKLDNPGPGITRPRNVSGSKDPTPGGGW